VTALKDHGYWAPDPAFLDISIGGQPVGRMEIEVSGVTDNTSDNFIQLCTGSRGKTPDKKHDLHYLNSVFHRIVPGFMAQGGDFTNGDGTGGHSIYGKKHFDDEYLKKHKHEGRGAISMANCGPNTNNSQFCIFFDKAPSLDGVQVVFACVASDDES